MRRSRLGQVLSVVLAVVSVLAVSEGRAEAYSTFHVRNDEGQRRDGPTVNLQSSARPQGVPAATLPLGAAVQIVCQTRGVTASIARSNPANGRFDSSVWDVVVWPQGNGGVWFPELGVHGLYVNDGLLTTVPVDEFSSGVPRCGGSYAVDEIMATGGANLGSLAPGQLFQVQVGVHLTSSVDLAICADKGEVRLGTASPRDHQSSYASNWLSGNRADFFVGLGGCTSGLMEQVGGTYYALFTMRAPSVGGDYSETFGVVAEGQAWLSGPPIVVRFHVNGSGGGGGGGGSGGGRLYGTGSASLSGTFRVGDPADLSAGALNSGQTSVGVRRMMLSMVAPGGGRRIDATCNFAGTSSPMVNFTVAPGQTVQCEASARPDAPGTWSWNLDWEGADGRLHRSEMYYDGQAEVASQPNVPPPGSSTTPADPPLPDPPVNDALASAFIIEPGQYTSGRNTQATAEQSDPGFAGGGGHTVWWTMVAPMDGTYSVSLDGSTFDPMVVVLETDSSRTVVAAADDDAEGGTDDDTLTPNVSFHARTGERFAIAVDGYGSSVGDIAIHAALVPDGASAFTSGTPTRVLDTRPSSRLGYTGAKPGAGAVLEVPIIGRAGVPAGATAAVITLTGTESSGPGYLQAYPTGRAAPGTTSSLNFDRANQTVANTLIVPVGDRGSISIFTNAGAHVVLDVSGWFGAVTEPQGAGRFFDYAVPERVLDTRTANRPLPANGRITLDLLGEVPPGGRTFEADDEVSTADGPGDFPAALLLNITATETAGPGYLQAAAAGSLVPGATSVLNINGAGETAATFAVVPVRDYWGDIEIYSTTRAHLVVDVLGFFTDGSGRSSDGGFFVPTAPRRLLDTRAPSSAPRPAGGARHAVAIDRGLPPAVAGGVFVNLTVTDPVAPGFLQVADPEFMVNGASSNLNYVRGTTRANGVLVGASQGVVGVFAQVSTHVVVDQLGWFTRRHTGETDAVWNRCHRTQSDELGLVVYGGPQPEGLDIYEVVPGCGEVYVGGVTRNHARIMRTAVGTTWHIRDTASGALLRVFTIDHLPSGGQWDEQFCTTDVARLCFSDSGAPGYG